MGGGPDGFKKFEEYPLVITENPSQIPSTMPSQLPSKIPSRLPSRLPSQIPSKIPSQLPSRMPSLFPSQSNIPTQLPTASPTREKISEIICLEKDYKYSFTISDSFGDGLCCSEGEGSYAVKIDDVTIMQGGQFTKLENFWFKHKQCIDDINCDDGD